jgi:hypothetical protein
MRLLNTRRALLRIGEALPECDAPAPVAAATARVFDVDAPPPRPREAAYLCCQHQVSS